MVTKA